MKLCALCIVRKCSHHLATCNTLYFCWAAHLHLALALLPFPRHDLPQLPLVSFPARLNPTQIHGMWVLTTWPCPQPSQVMSPSILPKTRILQNTRIYVSNHYSSTDRAWRRLMILLRALRRPLLNRMWTMSKFVLCWLHHCTCRSEKQMRTDRKYSFFTVFKVYQICQVHLKIRRVRRDPLRCFQAKNRWNQETFSEREDFSSGHQKVLETMNRY